MATVGRASGPGTTAAADGPGRTGGRADARAAGPGAERPDPGPERRAARAFGEVLAEAGDRQGLDAVLRPAAAALCALIGVGRCSLYLRDGRSGRYKGRLGHPATLDGLVRRLTMGGPSDTLTLDVLASRTAVPVPDVRRDPRAARSVIRDQHVCSVLVVPMVHDGQVLGLAYLDDEGRRRDFPTEDREVALALAGLIARWIDRSLRVAQLTATRDELARERTVLRRAGLAERRLAEVADGDVDEVLAVVAELAGRPVEAVAADGSPLGGDPWAPGDAGAPRTGVLGRDGAGMVLRRLEGAEPGQARIVEPDLGAGLRHRCVAAPLAAPDGAHGFVALVDRDGRLGPFDQLLAVRAASALAAAGRRRHTADLAREDVVALVLAQLLGERLDRDDGAAVAARIGIVDRPRLVAVLRAGASPAAGPPLDAAALIAALPAWSATALRLEHELVLVAELSPGAVGRDVAPVLRDDLVAALHHAGAAGLVGVSALCRDLGGLPRALGQARALLGTVPPRTDAGGPVVAGLTVDELGPSRLLITEPGDAGRLGEELLGPLLDPDPSIRDLLRTLTGFFAAGSSIRATAAALDVHENTVRHRFGRVRALTGLDVAGQVDDQLLARAALAALELSGSPAVEAGDDPA